MTKMLRILIVLATVIPFPSVVRAEGGAENGVTHPPGKHGHRSPHGGQVASVGSYHFELVIHEGEIHLYLFSQGMTPLPVERVTGDVEILAPGQEIRRTALKPGSEALEAKLDLIGVRKFIAVVTLIIEGKGQTARFSFDFRAHHRDDEGAPKDDVR